MLAGAGPVDERSRRSTHKSTSASDPEIQPIQPDGATGADAELPTIDDVVDEFYSAYPQKAGTFLVHDGGDDPRDPRVKLREEVVEVTDGGDAIPITWGGGLRRFLEWHAEREGTRGRFKHADGSTFEKELLNSYDAGYFEVFYARLMALHREVAGGERPTGEWTAGEYDDPHAAMVTLTSSGTYAEDNSPRGPVDHQMERREAWGPTYKRLYDRLEAEVEAGAIDEWMYVVVEEHHPGEGWALNAGLGHDHVVVFTDGEPEAGALEDVVDTWVAECPGATAGAHEGAVKIRPIDTGNAADPGVVNSAGGYLVKYLGDIGDHPLERSVEQLAHQALKFATNTRRVRKSDRAGEAIRADRCRQAHDRGDQELGHAEQRAHREEGRGPEVVCAACGSSWGVDGAEGAETLVESRRSADVDETPGETSTESQDGGPSLISRGGERRVREPLGWLFASAEWVWKDATAGVSTSGESFDRPPPGGWELEAVLIQEDDEPDGVREARPSSGSGVDMVPVRGIDQFLLDQSERMAGLLEHRRQRDREGEAPPEPELPEPGGWDRPPPRSSGGGGTYAVLQEPTQADRRSLLRRTVRDLEGAGGAPVDEVLEELQDRGVSAGKAEHALKALLERGELYEPASGRLRVT